MICCALVCFEGRPTARRPTPLAKIELLILDVDGVLTDGRLYFGARAKRSKYFTCATDTASDYSCTPACTWPISGRRSAAVSARMRELGVATVMQGCNDKVAALQRIARRIGVPILNCACIVDDTPDLPLMSAVGFAAAVADAHPLVRSAAHWVARTAGGCGAVRELCDELLRARAVRRLGRPTLRRATDVVSRIYAAHGDLIGYQHLVFEFSGA